MPRKKKVKKVIISKEVIKAYEDVGYRVLCFCSPNDPIKYTDVYYPDKRCRRKIRHEGNIDLMLGWAWIVEQLGEEPPEAKPETKPMF